MKAPKITAVPSTNNGLNVWATNFSTQVTANPTQYGLTAGMVAPLAALRSAFSAALLATQNAQGTIATTATFQTAKQNLLNTILPLRQIIAAMPETIVSRAYKTAIGVNPHFTSRGVAGYDAQPRTPVPVTKSTPVIDALPVDNLTLKLTYHYSGAGMRQDGSKKRSSAKPEGAAQVEFFYKLLAPSTRAPYDGMVMLKPATRSPFLHTFDGAIGGRTVFIAARYVSARGEVGEWSNIVSCTVPIIGGGAVSGPIGGGIAGGVTG